ncbi:MAG: hypothetical protein LBC91_01595 [Candidatus Accumulibacter sp.]|jgi:hypothetical protein|nr:hypothetical protein [Accumulibacter sp.]
MSGRTNMAPPASMRALGKMIGREIVSTPSFETMTVSSLLVPVIEGFQRVAWGKRSPT